MSRIKDIPYTRMFAELAPRAQEQQETRVTLSAQTAVNKIHSTIKYLIWMHDGAGEEITIVQEAFSRFLQEEGTQGHSLDAALEYSSKWEQIYMFHKDELYKQRREEQLKRLGWREV